MDFSTLTKEQSTPKNLLNLQKGEKLDLTKASPSLKKVILAGGWDAVIRGATADLDLAAFLVGESGYVEKIPDDVVFFNHQETNGVKYGGDNRIGGGNGDDETMVVDLEKIDENINKIVFSITIFQAQEKYQNFGQIKNAYVRLLNAEEDNEELVRYSLTEEFSTETAVFACELVRNKNGWDFVARGDGRMGDLNTLLMEYVK